MSGDQAPARVRVTAPARRRRPVTRTDAGAEIDAETLLGDLYLRSLLRAQLLLAGSVIAVLVLTLGSVPLLFHLFPGVAQLRLIGVPLPFVLLGFGAYPLLLLLGWAYVRRAEANELAFTALLDSPEEEA